MATADSAMVDALSSLSDAELKDFARGNAGTVVGNIESNLVSNFGPALNATNAAASNYDLLTNYAINSKNLNDTLGGISGNSDKNVNILSGNTATASRTREIKEWYYNNKLDTLFVFQLIFISLSLLGVLAYLIKMNIIGAGVFGAMIGILIVVNILVIANRAVYTDKVRDKRYWSKRGFGVVGSPLPGGILAATVCPT